MTRPFAAALLSVAIAGCAATAPTGSAPSAPPPARIDRVYLSVDSETYEAAKGSAFLRDQFAHVQERTSTLADGTERTVLDLDFGASGVSLVAPGPDPMPEGWATVVFAVESEADLARVRDEMARSPALEPSVVQRSVEVRGRAEPAYREVVPAPLGEGLTLRTRVIAYQPGALAARGTPLPPDGRLTTAAYLDTGSLPARLGADISSVSLALGPRDAEMLDTQLTILGYTSRADSKVTFEYAGHGATVRFFDGAVSRRQYRVLGVTVALKSPVPAGRQSIGPYANIRFDGAGSAEIRFE